MGFGGVKESVSEVVVRRAVDPELVRRLGPQVGTRPPNAVLVERPAGSIGFSDTTAAIPVLSRFSPKAVPTFSPLRVANDSTAANSAATLQAGMLGGSPSAAAAWGGDYRLNPLNRGGEGPRERTWRAGLRWWF